MGYESKLVVVNVFSAAWVDKPYAEIIAEVNCAVMGHEFYEFVKKNGKPIDFRVYIDNDEEPTDEDKYGAALVEIPIKECIEFLKTDADLKTYRRAKVLCGLLTSLKPKDWADEDIRLVHYGY